MIRARTGALDLEFLADWDVEAALQWLDGLHGVGAKIAATVLNFSTLRMRVLAVDTHLQRVGERLGFPRQGADYQQGYDGYARLLPEEWTADDLYSCTGSSSSSVSAVAGRACRRAILVRCARPVRRAASTPLGLETIKQLATAHGAAVVPIGSSTT